LIEHFAPLITPYTHGTGCQDVVVASAIYLVLDIPVYIYDAIAFAILIYYLYKQLAGSMPSIVIGSHTMRRCGVLLMPSRLFLQSSDQGSPPAHTLGSTRGHTMPKLSVLSCHPMSKQISPILYLAYCSTKFASSAKRLECLTRPGTHLGRERGCLLVIFLPIVPVSLGLSSIC
jgi:hypothetical protein